ncbi:MAG: iron-containing alcohol dehydrogenase [Thermoanaerobacteraceae bacterium]|nr:iron-containing alcohol dehydrogenase [Thermoanaerobacteraceae bacterium]
MVFKKLQRRIEGLSVREAAEVVLEAIEQLSRDIGIPSGLKELGVKEEGLETARYANQAYYEDRIACCKAPYEKSLTTLLFCFTTSRSLFFPRNIP